MMNDEILILLATYNGEKYIREQLESILKQSYKPIKILIHDDGSQDNTIKIVKNMQKKYQNILLLEDGVRLKSPQGNFFHLTEYAQRHFKNTKYFAFSDQDDVWDVNKLKIEMETLKSYETNYHKDIPLLVYTDLYVVDQYLNMISTSFHRLLNIQPKSNSLNRLLVRNVVTGCTTLVNRPLLDLIQYKDVATIKMHDWWFALIARLFGDMIYIPKQLVYYRQHSNNAIGAKKKSLLEHLKILKSYNPLEFQHYIVQGKQLYEIFGPKIKDEDKKNILEVFINLGNLSPMNRKFQILKNKFLYKSRLQDLALILKI